MRARAYCLMLLALVLCPARSNPIGLSGAGDKTHDGNAGQRLKEAQELEKSGETSRAKKIYQELAEAPGLQGSRQAGLALAALSKIESSEGKYADSIRHAGQAAQVFDKAGEHAEESRALNSKAVAEVQEGDYVAATRDLTVALAQARQANDSQIEVQTLNNQGSAAYYLGQYSTATLAYDRAEEILARKKEPWTAYWLQITKVNQATLQQKLGRIEYALETYKQIQATSEGLTNSDRAHIDGNMGTLYRRLGDPQKALAVYSDAQRLYAREQDSDGEIGILKNIAIVYALDLKDLSRARMGFEGALQMALRTHNRREEMQARLYLAETLLRAGEREQARSQFLQARTLAETMGTMEERWKALYGIGRIEESDGHGEEAERDLRESIATIERTRSQLPLSPIRADFFADKREPYDALLSMLFGKGELAPAFELLERSRARVFQDKVLGKEHGEERRVSLAEVQSTLDDHTLLLEYWVGADRVGMIWCTREHSGMAVTVWRKDEGSQLRELLGRLPESLENSPRAIMSQFDFLVPAAPTLPPGIHHLVVVPDDWVESVPFDLLSAHDGTEGLLIERYDISTTPTAALLLRPKPMQKRIRWPWSRQMVGFGDPLVRGDESNGAGAINRDTLQLRAAEYELRDVAKELRGNGKLYVRERDQKSIFLNGEANAAPILHVSTHAFADMDNPENSRLLFSSDTEGPAGDSLYLREMYGLNLSRVQLATFSACDTARGRVIRGEGAQAFSRALLSSGAGAALTSLWRVDDRLTAEFMRQFYYFGMRRGTSKAEALRLAKMKFLRSGSELSRPSVWAAFVLSGDGLSPLPSVVSWYALVFMTAIALVALFAALRLWRSQRVNRQHSA